MAKCAAVVIGRNEGQRLLTCLKSVMPQVDFVVYVDSGSTDGSVAAARELGCIVHELDRNRPFSAARARNAGAAVVGQADPGIAFLQFVDGDCELRDSWIRTATQWLEPQLDVGLICGHLRERFPEASPYNRLCQLEWNGPTGDIPAVGGIFLARARCLLETGGFNETLRAGEERELAMRVRARKWRIVRMDQEMAFHDSAMLHFRQWWKRQTRGGYGSLDLAARFGETRYRRQVASAEIWTIGWLALVLVCVYAAAAGRGNAWAFFASLFAVLLPLAQAARLTIQQHRRGLRWPHALNYGVFTMISKWAQVLGHTLYLRDRAAGRFARQIEYK